MITRSLRSSFPQYHTLSCSLLLPRIPAAFVRYPTAGSTRSCQEFRNYTGLLTTTLDISRHRSMSSASAAATAVKAEEADHLVKLGEDVFLLESQQSVKHDPKHPNVSSKSVCDIQVN